MTSLSFVALSSAEASWCCGEAGKKEKESARGALSIFFDFCFFYRDTQREPLRLREALSCSDDKEMYKKA